MDETSLVESLETASPGLGREIKEAPPKAGRLRHWRRHRWVLRRIVIGILTLLCVSIIIFAATQALPGNAAKIVLGRAQDPAAYRALMKEFGLDRSLPAQYVTWLGHVVRGNFGTSLVEHEPVSKVIGPAISNSTILVLFSSILSITVSILIGVITASRRDGWIDKAFNAFSFLFSAVPEFVTGIVLVILFGTTVFKILPSVSLIPPGSSALSNLDVFVLPVLTLTFAITPYLGRLVRGSMIDVLESDYVQMARLKGVSERRILFCHALPNALVPAIQGIAVALGYFAGGIVVVEFVFGFPGIGTALLNAISERDLPVIQAASLILGSVYVVVNLIADILVVYVTPRLRTGDH